MSTIFKSFSTAPGIPNIPGGFKLKRFYKEVTVMPHPYSNSGPDSQPIGKSQLKDCSIRLQSLSKSPAYWGVSLDDRVIKTLYKDDMFLPTKKLALGVAEEWTQQGESIILRSLKMTTLVTKAVRASVDEKHLSFMKREIAAILENDHMCFRDDADTGNSYTTQLSFL